MLIPKRVKSNSLIVLVSLLLAGCSPDEQNGFVYDGAIVGTYVVEDTSEWDEEDQYTIRIVKSAYGDPNVEITNFGGIMYVPVKAVLKENILSIPAQTYTGKTVSITISGIGTLNGSNLSFKYKIETDDQYTFEHSCIALRDS